MKTLTLTMAALLFLAIPGFGSVRADEPIPPTASAEAASVSPAAEAPAGEQTAETPDGSGGIGQDGDAEASAAAEAEAEPAASEDERVAEGTGADEQVAEGAGGAPEAAAPGAPVQAEAASDSLMMDVGEVLDELLWPEPYQYQSADTRDPFAPLVGKEGVPTDGPLAIGDMIVVGVVWGEDERFALVETRGGKNLVMRVGDEVQDGRVIAVLPDGLRISHTLYGITRVVTLPVRSGLEGRDER